MTINATSLANSDFLLFTLIGLLFTTLVFHIRPDGFRFRELWSLMLNIARLKNASPSSTRISLSRAVYAFRSYENLSLQQLQHMKNSYARLGREHKRLGYELGYPEKLKRLAETTTVNAKLTSALAQVGGSLSNSPLPGTSDADYSDLAKVRETLKHFVRDWSEEGKEERASMFQPILEVLSGTHADRRSEMKVLVPGSGLGRLAWEIYELGFDTTANELSAFMTVAMRFLLSEETTWFKNQHNVHPFAHWFSHQRSNDSLFRAVSFPDAIPRLSSRFKLLEEDFFSLSDSPSTNGEEKGYDFVVTLFFIDTSVNVISTLQKIHGLLKPNGCWINLGPLLWPGGGQTALELSLEEVLRLSKLVGFEVDEGTRKIIPSEYTADSGAMMKWIYQTEFWVGKKVS